MKKEYCEDFRGYLIKYLENNYLKIIVICFSLLKRMECVIKGIQLGRMCKFYGNTIFHREPLTEISIGNNCTFRSNFKSNFVGLNHKCLLATLRKGAQLKIGNHCGISGATISIAYKAIIHDNVLIGANAFITDFDWHNIDPLHRHEPCTEYKAVEIRKNAWIGINTVILKGVTIGENSIIGANSVVTDNIPDNVIAAGNPCKIIRNIR